MKIVIADANIWIGAFIHKDRYHQNGKKFLLWLESKKDVRVIIPIGVVYEVIAYVLNSQYGGFEKAEKALDLFMTHEKFDVYYNTEESFQAAQDIFRRYNVFSLVDSTIIVLYENLGCSLLYSTDGDYNHCTFINRLEFPV